MNTIKMTKDGGVKNVNSAETKELLLEAGWAEVKEAKKKASTTAKKLKDK